MENVKYLGISDIKALGSVSTLSTVTDLRLPLLPVRDSDFYDLDDLSFLHCLTNATDLVLQIDFSNLFTKMQS